MKSLRDLLQTLLSWLHAAICAWTGTTNKEGRPAHGPAHPRRYVRVMRATGAPTPVAVGTPRVARPPLPPHLAALLAAAPEVEPEFAHKRRRAAKLLAMVRGAARSVRAFAPRPPPRDARSPAPTGRAWLLRARRATSEVHEGLVLADPPPGKGLSPRPASA